VKIPCRRDVNLIYGLDDRVYKDHHESEQVHYEPDDHGYRVTCAHGDRGYANDDRDYVSYDRVYVSYDRDCVNDVRGYANDDHDYDLYIENEAFRFSIQDYAQSILHAKDARATLRSSLRLADANDENASNYDDLLHAHHYEESA